MDTEDDINSNFDPTNVNSIENPQEKSKETMLAKEKSYQGDIGFDYDSKTVNGQENDKENPQEKSEEPKEKSCQEQANDVSKEIENEETIITEMQDTTEGKNDSMHASNESREWILNTAKELVYECLPDLNIDGDGNGDSVEIHLSKEELKQNGQEK